MARRGTTLLAAAAVASLWGQTTTTTTGTGTGSSATGAANGTASTSASAPTVTSPTVTGVGMGTQRSIFLSGLVMMDDGSPLPGSVDILSLCGPARRTMAHASASGSFGFQWASTINVFADASQAARVPAGGGVATVTSSRNGSRGIDPLSNCDLLAEFPGHSSSKVSLYNRAGQDSFDVGVIVLHRIAVGDGHTVSMLALKAPNAARKNFDKGKTLAMSGKTAQAVVSFEAAVAIYPQYADAWLSLGKVQWLSGRPNDARSSFSRAMQLDEKLVGAWQELGYLSCDESKWEDAIRYLDQAVRLDPLDSPNAWYFNALANYNLGRFDRAEHSLRAEMKLDNGNNAHEDYLFAMVLIARQDLKGGAAALRKYIASAPHSEDVTPAMKQLSRIQERIDH